MDDVWQSGPPVERKTVKREPSLSEKRVLGWPKICKFAHVLLWEHSYRRQKLAQLLGQLGVFLTLRYTVELSLGIRHSLGEPCA